MKYRLFAGTNMSFRGCDTDHIQQIMSDDSGVISVVWSLIVSLGRAGKSVKELFIFYAVVKRANGCLQQLLNYVLMEI